MRSYPFILIITSVAYCHAGEAISSNFAEKNDWLEKILKSFLNLDVEAIVNEQSIHQVVSESYRIIGSLGTTSSKLILKKIALHLKTILLCHMCIAGGLDGALTILGGLVIGFLVIILIFHVFLVEF